MITGMRRCRAELGRSKQRSVIRGGWSRGSIAHGVTGRSFVLGSVAGRAYHREPAARHERDLFSLTSCDLAAGKSGPR